MIALRPDAATKAGTDREQPRRPLRRLIFRWIERVLAVVGLCFLVWRLCFELIVMTSESMAPTLKGTSYQNGDRIIVEKVTGYFRSPRRWEIYYLHDAEGNSVAKRIVGLPGEKISIRDGRVYINGTEAVRPARLQFLKYYALGNLERGQEIECGTGYFVLGDDSVDSYDSRYLGPVKPEQFHGRVWCIVRPLARFGFVH